MATRWSDAVVTVQTMLCEFILYHTDKLVYLSIFNQATLQRHPAVINKTQVSRLPEEH